MGFYLFIIAGVFSQTCYQYTCTILDSGICAQLNPGTQEIFINELGCNENYCDKSVVEDTISDDNPSIPCSTSVSSPEAYNYTLNEIINCTIRNNSVADFNMNLSTYMETGCNDLCFHEDGSNSSCICGFDGRQYCQPNISSGLFYRFWEICDSNSNTIDNKTYQVWVYLQEHFVEILTAPFCADDVFEEVNIPNLDYLIDMAQWVIVTGLIILILI